MAVIWEDKGLKVLNKDGVHGLVATTNFKINEVVCIVEGELINAPNRYSVQVGAKQHVNVEAPVKYINHCCNANIKLVGRKFVAIKPISSGTEITFNYNDTEEVLAEPFTCFYCNQEVKGSAFVAEYPCLN